jgi:hypothetical protein
MGYARYGMRGLGLGDAGIDPATGLSYAYEQAFGTDPNNPNPIIPAALPAVAAPPSPSGIDPATGLSYAYEANFGTNNPAAGGNAPIAAQPPGTVLTSLFPQLPPGPAPRTNVPLTSSSLPMYLTNSTLISGLPNWAVFGLGFVALTVLPGMFGGKRRR